jgi:hypothetical protein
MKRPHKEIQFARVAHTIVQSLRFLAGVLLLRAKLRMRIRAILLLTSAAFTAFAHAEWQDYKPGTLAKIVADNPHPPTVDYQTTAGDFSYVVSVQFTGERRVLPPEKRHVISQWVESLKLDGKILSAFSEEFRFIEAGKSYWLPVQASIVPRLVEEVSAQQPLHLYAVWIGSTKSEWVFIVNEFRTGKN